MCACLPLFGSAGKNSQLPLTVSCAMKKWQEVERERDKLKMVTGELKASSESTINGLNERIDMTKEFLSEGLLTACLVVVNILIPIGVVAHEVLRIRSRNPEKQKAPERDAHQALSKANEMKKEECTQAPTR